MPSPTYSYVSYQLLSYYWIFFGYESKPSYDILTRKTAFDDVLTTEII